VALDELGTSNKVKLILKVKQPQDASPAALPKQYPSNSMNPNFPAKHGASH
jgi:hypothetical protein